MRILFIIGLFLTFCTIPSYAQFTGGNEDGSSNNSINGIGLDGEIASFTVLYNGKYGDGHGSGVAYSSLFEPIQLYGGGSGDGYTAISTVATPSGGAIVNIYLGTDGDGYAHSQKASTLNGAQLRSLYAGASGDGFARSQGESTLDGIALHPIFEGTIGDGFTNKVTYNLFLNGNGIPIYVGGIGDGFNTDQIFDTYLNGLVATLNQGQSKNGNKNNELTDTEALDILEEMIQLDMVLFPNPASSRVHVELSNPVTILDAKLFDLNGREVNIDLNEDNSISLDHISEGIYVLTIYSENQEATKKLIIKR